MRRDIHKFRRLIQLNKMRAEAKDVGDLITFRDVTLKLHKLEIKDGVAIGTYTIRIPLT